MILHDLRGLCEEPGDDAESAESGRDEREWGRNAGVKG